MRVLGIDYGRRRIGLALSDATGLLARPWKTVPSAASIDAVARMLADEIAGLRAEADELGAIVLGYPRRLSGEANEQTALVQALADRLRPLVPDLPLTLQDERLSSREAEAQLAVRERDWKKRKPLLDSTAAAVILQDYLDTVPR